MGLFRILDIAGTAMNAQSVRLNATASNLANAESVSSSVETREISSTLLHELGGKVRPFVAPLGVL